nr:MAG: sulfotransferase [Leptolyngbya sp. IPPAS B-1204]
MSIGLEGQNLIFLISQPRAGSTLTQKILGSHPQIHTISEPWIMLPLLYPLCYDDLQAEYNTKLARIGWDNFFQQLPDSKTAYYEHLSFMYADLYSQVLKPTGKKYFLDKTPRYYYIISEIYKVFPQAQFIILLRNPLAVLCSIIATWVKSDWLHLDQLKNDIVKAPGLLLEGIRELGDDCLVLHYEKLIAKPEIEFKRVCQAMKLKFAPKMIEYGATNSTVWRFGDQKLVYQKSRPDPQNSDKWILLLKDPQTWQIANDYLEFLGHETLFQMGYSYQELRKILDTHRPQELDSADVIHVEWLQRESNQNIEFASMN